MDSDTTTARRLLWRRRVGRSEAIALVIAAFALALGAAAWIAYPDQTAPLAMAALPENSDLAKFDDRFLPTSTGQSLIGSTAWRALDRSAFSAVQTKLREAKGLLAQQLRSEGWRSAFVDDAKVDDPKIDDPKIDDSKSSASADVPLPRPRPVEADLESRAEPALAQADNAPQPDNGARPDNRTLLQKLSDLLPAKITLASLAPDGGLFRRGPDLASLGYDNLTAVYDISARTVYLPNGSKLEAHSGMGSLMDDPEHVHQHNVGATPPAVYDLKPRERLFHGVSALRMIPVDGNSTLGRSGLLAHSYMLGPNGDSNGCVSIKNYDRFLKAYNDGEINRLVVVPSLSGVMSASQRSTSQS